MELGRYIETLEINEKEEFEEKTEIKIETKEDNFENEAILDITKRYEENAIELKLDEINDDALDIVNNDRVYKLKINETQYNIEQNIKTENMFWSGSKLFTQAFVHNSKKLAPIPGVVNSSSITAQVTPDLEATIGQTYLFNSFGVKEINSFVFEMYPINIKSGLLLFIYIGLVFFLLAILIIFFATFSALMRLSLFLSTFSVAV